MIYQHPDGSFHRYKFMPASGGVVKAEDEYSNDANWKQVPGAPLGVQIHRDGKTMRNTAPAEMSKITPAFADKLYREYKSQPDTIVTFVINSASLPRDAVVDEAIRKALERCRPLRRR